MARTTLRPAPGRRFDRGATGAEGALPNLVVIGAMKCGTTALHEALGRHPEIAMSDPKELNFFFGPAAPAVAAPLTANHPHGVTQQSWAQGNWHRGPVWYARHFDPQAAVRGESSPGYTSPAHEEAAGRMAALVPSARLVYLVRDPVARAVSQYRHHRSEGAEARDMETALADPSSQYLARSRYHERLRPFLDRFGHARVAIVAQEELLLRRRETLRRLYAFAGVDEDVAREAAFTPRHLPPSPDLDRRLRQLMVEALRDDAHLLRTVVGRDLPGWSL